jgi:hypothetical protein
MITEEKYEEKAETTGKKTKNSIERPNAKLEFYPS